MAAAGEAAECRCLRLDGAYDEFCAGFPYEETEDQLAAIDATLKDLGAGKPIDRKSVV